MAQFELFTEAPPVVTTTPTAESVRAQLAEILATLAGTDKMPWTAAEERLWRTTTPQMANWLPWDEAEAFRAAFAAELARLSPMQRAAG